MADLETNHDGADAPDDSPQADAAPSPDTASNSDEGNTATEAPSNDLEGLLAIFDRSVSARDDGPDGTSDGEAPTGGIAAPDIGGVIGQGLVDEFNMIRDWAVDLDDAYRGRLEKEDAQTLFAVGQDRISHTYAADDFAQRWLISEAQLDPDLAAAWSERHNNEETAARYRKVAEKAMKRLVRAAEAIPDQEASEIREAVTAAVRGASKTAPEVGDFDADAVARMNDQDFAHWTKHTAPKLVRRGQ